jgi:hypothetical protein
VLATDRGEVVAELIPRGKPTSGSGALSCLVALAKSRSDESTDASF